MAEKNSEPLSLLQTAKEMQEASDVANRASYRHGLFDGFVLGALFMLALWAVYAAVF